MQPHEVLEEEGAHAHHPEPKYNPNSLFPNEAKGNASVFATIPFQIRKMFADPKSIEPDFSRTDLAGKGADGKGRQTTPLEDRQKPKFSLEFNRDGEKELYACNTPQAYPLFRFKEAKWSLLGIATCFTGLYNPFFQFNWLTTLQLQFAGLLCFLPHFNQGNSAGYRVKSMHLLHGGEFVRLEFVTQTGKPKTSWVSIEDFQRLDSSGQMVEDDRDVLRDNLLNEESKAMLKKFDDYGVCTENEIVWFSEQGNVSDPELFEQVMKGVSIDTHDYYINLGNERPFNQQDGYL